MTPQPSALLDLAARRTLAGSPVAAAIESLEERRMLTRAPVPMAAVFDDFDRQVRSVPLVAAEPMTEIQPAVLEDEDGAPREGFSDASEDEFELSSFDDLTVSHNDLFHNGGPHGTGCTCSFCMLPPSQDRGFVDRPDEVRQDREFRNNGLRRNDVQSFGIASAAPTSAAAAPLSETFQLNSLPGADHVIYLDFDGHVEAGPWAATYNNDVPINAPAYSLDGNFNSFSNAELERIQQVWQRVAEDYAPFNVNVTTEEPPADFLARTSSNDERWGGRVVIGGNSNDWFTDNVDGAAGGVAYLNSFASSFDTVSWVFPPNLGNSAKNIAEAASHEAGHMLGLRHDGEQPGDGEYYRGHGSGVTSWAPIMGVGYSVTLSQWSDGGYRGATQFQDDLSIIASSSNGFGFKADDHTDDFRNTAAATPIVPDAEGNFEAGGIISERNDQDNLRIEHAGGFLSVEAEAAERGPNLDIELRLHRLVNGQWQRLATSNPTNDIDAAISGDYPAGTYMFRVDGVGLGNPQSSNISGYTDYGSLGQYTLSGTVAVTTETDNLPQQILPIELAGNLLVSHTGTSTDLLAGDITIDSPGDIDRIAFSTDFSGQVTFDLADASSAIDPVLALYSYDTVSNQYNRIAIDDNGGAGDDARITFNLIGQNRYALAVGDATNNFTGDLSLTVTTTGSAAPGAIPLDVDGVGDVAGSLNPAGDTDYFSFTIPSNGTGDVSVSLTSPGGVDLVGVIYDTNNDVVATIDSVSTTADLSGLATGATYFVATTTFNHLDSASYNLAIDAELADPEAPRIIDLWLGSTAWTREFRNALDPTDGIGYRVPTGTAADQLATLPWAGIDQISVRFNEPVNVSDNAMTLELSDNLPVVPGGFAYDLTTNTATWTNANPLPNGSLAIGLDDARVIDDSGNALDGEWTDGTVLPSGDGSAGGDFLFSVRLLAADADQSGSVNLGDFGALRASFGDSIGDENYDLFADFNGDGDINLADFGILRANFGESV
jgi:hypothetical protein